MLTLSHTEELRRAVSIAQAIAREHQHLTFSPGHLLEGILHNDVGLASQLVLWDIDVPYLRDWADIRIEAYPKSARPVEEPKGDAQIRALMEVADVVRMKLGESELSPIAVLMAMCKPDVAFSRDQLKSFPLTENQLLEKAVLDIDFQQAINGKQTVPTGLRKAVTVRRAHRQRREKRCSNTALTARRRPAKANWTPLLGVTAKPAR